MSAKCFIGAKAGALRVTKYSNGQARPLALTCRAGKIELNTQPRQATGLSLVPNGEQRLRVLTLVASCVQVNSDLARFEQVAGRTAMIAFAVALVLEPGLPDGVFSTWVTKTDYLLAASLLVVGAAALAANSKRAFGGLGIQKTVLSCMTAFTRLASSNLQKSVDLALDRVFEQVFGSQFVDANFVDFDDFI